MEMQLEKIKAAATEIWSNLTSNDNRLLTVFWSACVFGVIAMGILIQTRPAGFLGIADTRESVINFEFPVTIQRIHVIPGQLVQRGDLIAELEQPDLEMKIHIAQSQLEKLQAEQNLKRELTQLSSGVIRQNPKIKSQQTSENDADVHLDPLETQIRSFKHELSVLQNRKKNLYVFADISGVIGSVNFKKGETASSFSSLITISPLAPTYVQGFVYESLQYQVKVGQKMQVHSLTDNNKLIEGRVVSVGSRIVELPLRLLHSQNQKLWGREVSIEIPSTNHFLLGEKVEITPKRSWISVSSAQADNIPLDGKTKIQGADLLDLMIPEAIQKISAVEPSGAVYLSELHKYAVVSDDTDEADTPLIFLVNHDGSVDPAAVTVEGIDTIQDIESISQDQNGFLYLLGSQGLTGKNKIKRDRNLLVKVKRDGMRFKAIDQFELRPKLVEAIQQSSLQELQPLHAEAQAELEIEGSLIQQGHLWVALKKPLDQEGHSLILDLGTVEQIFSSHTIEAKNLKIVAQLAFETTGQGVTHISEILLVEKDLLIGTFSKNPGNTGHLWKWNLETEKLTLLAEYPSHSPEGLAYNPQTQELLILFDEGSSPAKYQKLNYPTKK